MRMQAVSHKKANLPHYRHIVAQLPKKKYSSELDAPLKIQIRQWVFVRG